MMMMKLLLRLRETAAMRMGIDVANPLPFPRRALHGLHDEFLDVWPSEVEGDGLSEGDSSVPRGAAGIVAEANVAGRRAASTVG